MQLSRESAMEPSKLHRYLVSLCRFGLVAKSEDGVYALGSGAIRLGAVALAGLDKNTAFEEVLRSLVDAFGESAFLYVWTTSGPVMIRMCKPPYSPVTLPVGTIASLVSSACGPVFAAYLPDAVVAEIVERDASSAGIDPQVALRDLREIIAPQIRQNLVHISETTLLPNISASAAPVFDAQGDLAFVLGASIRRHQVPAYTEQVAVMVREAAKLMSRRLGHILA